MENSTKIQGRPVVSVPVSDEEKRSKIPSAATVGAAVSILQRDGIVVIKNVVDIDALDTLNSILTPKSEVLAGDPSTHWNFNKEARNITQPPPYKTELMFDTIWANPFAAAVGAAILGPRPHIHYANGNTALRSEGRQPVHADLGERHLRFPFALVANFFLVDTDATNGSTEVWVGSHRDTSIEDHDPSTKSNILPELVEARRKMAPPVQPEIQKGDLVLRDVRLWHAGMPNQTDVPRVMLAFVMFPWWYESSLRLVLPRKSKQLVEKWKRETGFEYAAEFVDAGEPTPAFKASSASGNASVVY
jgi:hypothetical protein